MGVDTVSVMQQNGWKTHHLIGPCEKYYRKISNVSRTKSHNFNDSPVILQLFLPNPLKPGTKSRMKM